jgi:hypothetical protein
MLRAKYNLNGHPSLKGATKMRVFCPEHKRGFFAPRQSPIKCENRGHLLGEIDFEGGAHTPVEIQWQYCCNCEHFCPVDFDQYGLQRCPVCTRRSSLLYLCDRCYIISFESNTPLQTKNFTLTADGAPQPSCPGCLRPASADLHEHACDEVNASFVTGLSACPVCEERLDIAPAFPSLVAQYLKRTKAANKTSVTFDYETGTFVPVEDGEFVVVTNMDQPIVLPRTARFSTKRDFYEYYQDYYHCPNPDAGEVQIVQPAIVAPAANGWSLESTGALEVIKEQTKRKVITPVAAAIQPPAPAPEPAPAPAPAPLPVPRKEQQSARECPDCGSSIEAKYAFCWKCGNAMDGEKKPSGRNPGILMSSAIDLDDELTVQHEPRPHNSTMLPWTTSSSERPVAGRGSVLKLMSIGAGALLIVSLGLFGLLRSDTPAASATAEPVVQQPAAAQQPATITTEVSRTASAQTTTTQQVAPVTPEDELQKLRERGMTAKASERSKIIQAYTKVEKQYPRDYRFPYERAKFVVKAKRRTEAFKALKVAAERAITTGKANEMLSGLETDKTSDFSELWEGSFKWSRLVAALKRKDPTLLSE